MRTSRIGAAHLVAAMATGVDHRPNLAGGVAGNDDRLVAHAGGEEVTRPGNLALMAEHEPAPGEDPLKLEAVDLGVAEDPPAHQSTVQVDKLIDVDAHRRNLVLIMSGWALRKGCFPRKWRIIF